MITIYTAIIDGYDKLEPPEMVCDDCEYIVFSDAPIDCPPWKNITHPRIFESRRESRCYKIMMPVGAPGDEVVWMDGHTRLRGNTAEWVRSSLANHDIALRKHPDRDCVYDEAAHCIEHRCDFPDVIEAQMREFRAEGYPEKRGLSWAGVVMRRNTPRIRRFNELWWSYVLKKSIRDQLSFDRCAWKAKIGVNHLPVDDPHVEEMGHLKHTRRMG